MSGEPGRDTRAILQAAADGELDTLLLFGADVIADFPDADLAERALQGGAHVVTVELFPTATVTRSDIVLPSAAYAEREGTFTNLERRIQKLEPLLVPPGATREPWRICASLARQLGSDWGWHTFDDVWNDIKSNVRTHAHIDTGRARGPWTDPRSVLRERVRDRSDSFGRSGGGTRRPISEGIPIGDAVPDRPELAVVLGAARLRGAPASGNPCEHANRGATGPRRCTSPTCSSDARRGEH